MDQSTGPKIMVFQPVMDDFKDFNRYMESVEMLGAQKAGVCKIIPPKEWQPRRESYDDIQLSIPAPIEQVVQGSKGIYTQFNMQKRSMSVADFRRLANSVKYAPPASVLHAGDDFDTVERVYWKNITFNAPMYGADVSGSLTDPDQPYWNINQLGSILDTVYNDYRVKIEGVNTAYLYFGMWKASFAWHTEDLDLYSINYLHFGEPKSWYAIPPEAGRRVERLAASFFPESARQCPSFLRHKMTLISPTVLRSNGIPFQHVTQHAGEIMVTFPFGYHAGFNHGLNCAESTNFALPRWVEYGKRCSVCRCRKDSVRINMDMFVKKYQPERYEDWIAGRDVGPHPEDDQVWPTRRAVPVRGLSVQVDAAASSSASAPMASGSTCSSKSSSNLDAIFDQVVRDDVCDTDSSRKRHPPFSDFQKSDGFLQTQAKKIRTLSDSDSQSDSDSSDSDYLHSSDSSGSDSSDAEQVQVSRKEAAVLAKVGGGSRSMAQASASQSNTEVVANDSQEKGQALSVVGSPAFIGMATNTLQHYANEWPTWAASLWIMPERSNASDDQVADAEHAEIRANRLLSRTTPHCSVCSLFWTLQTRYEVLKQLAEAESESERGPAQLPARSAVLISEAVFGRQTLKQVRSNRSGPLGSPSKGNPGNDTCDLIVCSDCKLAVHSSCYGHCVTDGNELDHDQWLCKRCTAARKQRVSFSQLTCCLCCMRFGALKSTADGRWAHIMCALGNDLYFGDLLRREPILLTVPVTGSRKNSKRQDAESIADLSKSKARCVYCSVGKAGRSAAASTSQEAEDCNVSTSVCLDEQETVLDFTVGKRSVAGKCAQCYIIKPRQCPTMFHVTCGWFAGVAFEILDWPVLFSTVCFKHVVCIARETAGNTDTFNEIQLGQTVIAKNSHSDRYEHASVSGKTSKSFCDLDFLDGQYSSDTPPEHIESHNIERDGIPRKGTVVQVRWTDGVLYKAKFLGLNQQVIYEVEFQDGHRRSMGRDELYTLEQPLPRKVKSKLKHS